MKATQRSDSGIAAVRVVQDMFSCVLVQFECYLLISRGDAVVLESGEHFRSLYQDQPSTFASCLSKPLAMLPCLF